MTRRILLIDAGNTRVKWALTAVVPSGALTAVVPSGALTAVAPSGALTAVVPAEGNPSVTWLDDGAVATTLLPEVLPQIAASATSASGAPLNAVHVANVAGPRVADAITSAFPAATVRFESSQKNAFGIANQYYAPIRLGIDRYAALVAVHHLATFRKMSKLVVTAGTALTTDALTIDGQFIGGGIAPGLELMRRALNRDTAELPLAQDDDLPEQDEFGRNTEEGIASGVHDAAVGTVMLAAQRMQRKIDSPLLVVLSGGAAGALEAALKANLPQFADMITIEQNLVLQGLAVMVSNTVTNSGR